MKVDMGPVDSLDNKRDSFGDGEKKKGADQDSERKTSKVFWTYDEKGRNGKCDYYGNGGRPRENKGTWMTW